MTQPAETTATADFEANLHCKMVTDEGREYPEFIEMNEFTLNGKSWDMAKLVARFSGDRAKASAVWQFMESEATEMADDWEKV